MKNKNKEKITFFLPGMYGGGVERVFLTLAEEMLLRGYEIDLLLLKKEGDMLSVVPKQVRIIVPKTYSSKLFPALFMIPALIRYMRAERPVLFISMLNRCNVVVSLARMFVRGVPVVVSEHGNFTEQLQVMKWYKRKVAVLVSAFTYRLADTILAVSYGTAEVLAKHLWLKKDSIEVIYNPVNITKVQKMAEEQFDTTLLDIAKKNFVSVGRLNKEKNFPLLLDAFAIVLQKEPEARLLILGEGEERAVLEKKMKELGISNFVRMPGFVDNPYPYMKNADVFALSSDWEGFGVVIVEALACGTSVVATDCPSGPAEILIDESCGSLVPVGDNVSMSESITFLLNSNKNVNILKKRANDFTVSKVTDKYLNLIKDYN